MNRKYVAEYLPPFGINPADVGAVISEGKQHYTCRYHVGQVIKIPKNSLYMKTYRPLKRQALLRDMDILNTRFADYVTPTEIHFVDEHYVILQEYLPGGVNITPANFALVAADFARILEINRGVVQEFALSVDFFGSLGFQQSIAGTLLRQKQRAKMTNLLAVPQGADWRVRIVDVNLSELRFRFGGEINLFHWLVDVGVYHLTGLLLRDHYGVGL